MADEITTQVQENQGEQAHEENQPTMADFMREVQEMRNELSEIRSNYDSQQALLVELGQVIQDDSTPEPPAEDDFMQYSDLDFTIR